MKRFLITYDDPKLETETVDAESYAPDFEGNFIEFKADNSVVLAVSAMDVLSIRASEIPVPSLPTIYSFDPEEFARFVRKTIDKHEALKNVA